MNSVISRCIINTYHTTPGTLNGSLLVIKNFSGSRPELMNFLNGSLSVSKMLEKEFKPKTSWAVSWNVFDGRDKFLVSDPTTAIGGMNLYRKQCTVPCNSKI